MVKYHQFHTVPSNSYSDLKLSSSLLLSWCLDFVFCFGFDSYVMFFVVVGFFWLFGFGFGFTLMDRFHMHILEKN